MTEQGKAVSNYLRDLLGPLDGAEIAGGCDYCDAYQTPKQYDELVWILEVHHDPGCPWFLNYQQRHGVA